MSFDETKYKLYFRVSLAGLCEEGDLDKIKQFVKTRGITADYARKCENEALRESCASGHLETVKYLVDTFKLTADDVRAKNNWALQRSSMFGHLEVVKYLIEEIGLTPTPNFKIWQNPLKDSVHLTGITPY